MTEETTAVINFSDELPEKPQCSGLDVVRLVKILLVVCTFDCLAVFLSVAATGGSMHIFYGLLALVTLTSLVSVFLTVILLQYFSRECSTAPEKYNY